MDITQASAAPTSADADLAQFGYKQQLHRTIGSYTSFALAFSMISVTTTVFTLFAQPFQAIGGVAISRASLQDPDSGRSAGTAGRT